MGEDVGVGDAGGSAAASRGRDMGSVGSGGDSGFTFNPWDASLSHPSLNTPGHTPDQEWDPLLTSDGGRYSFPAKPVRWSGWVFKERRVRSPEMFFLQVDEDCVLLKSSSKEFAVAGELKTASIVLRGRGKGKKTVMQPVDRTQFDRCLVAIALNGVPESERCFDSFYYEFDLIGTGTSSKVWICIDRFTQQRFAVKKIPISSAAQSKTSMHEVMTMARVNHPNVLRLFDAFFENNSLLLVVELMRGGELFDIMAESESFSESQAQAVMKQILCGLEALHNNNIVHRDMKPENLLCSGKTWPLTVKIADFGISKAFDTSQEVECNSMAGTVAFMAPEIIRNEGYTSAVDIWACGCILYMMLTGAMPFPGANEVEVTHRIQTGLVFDHPLWSSGELSRAARNFIGRLLADLAANRPTTEGALSHVWMRQVHGNKALSYDSRALSSWNKYTPKQVIGALGRPGKGGVKAALKRAMSFGTILPSGEMKSENS